jgi:hypothetical protein
MLKVCGILRSLIGLLSLGCTDFTDIKLFREDKLFRDCLKLSFVPSEEILCQRLDGIAADDNSLKLIDDGKFLVKRNLRSEKLAQWLTFCAQGQKA